MNRLAPDDFVALFGRLRASAILRTPVEEAAAPAMDAAVRAGFRIVEFTLSIPNAYERIAEFARRDDLIVGAGTVLEIDEARAAVEAGASFLVSPVVDEAIIEESHRLGVTMMPGTHTPTEMLRAHRAGAPLQKLFPAPGIGPAAVSAIRGPMPFLRIVPTSGVDLDNVGDYLRAGAYAVGFVNPLFVPEDIQEGRFDRIEERGRRMLAEVTRS
ncbi:MAG: bifunctional 4-hydroxy-2-oxoglutarate aldolase/2-dehydro-3-deoxy-phosphogluconate aldolase [Planctomycetes bacterium]|nr:bifunctional 4-hydroxy-2-oxoglutarate aldolase/2-dehydro-3-deoxy-phosphogluconate aldolase [Planctomycetota bacterium]